MERVWKAGLPSWLLGGIVFAAAVALSIGIGFVGAPDHEQFDWRLSAEIGTAVGTILLAAYTAWLATTTRQEVSVAVEEQRARDRPTVVLTKSQVSRMQLEPSSGETVPILTYTLRNVGNGPAFNVNVVARYPGVEETAREVIAVLSVGEVIGDRPVSLSALTEPEDGFEIENFVVSGTYLDRTLRDRHDVRILDEAGLDEERRLAYRRAERRAHIDIAPQSIQRQSPLKAVYRPLLTNRGPAVAKGVVLELVRQDGIVTRREVGDLAVNHPTEVLMEVATPHEQLDFNLTWTDGDGTRSDRIFGYLAFTP